MASPFQDDVLEKLQQGVNSSTPEQHEADVAKRLAELYQKSQHRIVELVDDNATRPTTISSVTVLNAPHTRPGLLKSIFDPILSANNAEPYTLTEALQAVQKSVDKLNRLDIFQPPISTFIDRPSPIDSTTTPTDIAVFLSTKERPRLLATSGTWAGSNDGSVYFNVLLRNLFGGAESLSTNASFGTRTRSAYSAFFDTPLLGNPDAHLEIGGNAASTAKAWASHEELIKGGFARLKFASPSGLKHELSYTGAWRTVADVADNASPIIRLDAGDSVKSALSYSFTADRRDYPLLPTAGYYLKTLAELAGGPLQGDAHFSKFEFDSQAAVPVPIPFVKDSGISFTMGLRGGVIYPLAPWGESTPVRSRVTDRFFLGGPTDVRGFRFAGLGPQDAGSALGGDVYAAGGASLLFPLPRVPKDQPLRFQAFVNSGRLLALRHTRSQEEKGSGARASASAVQQSVVKTISDLGDGLPSTSVGLGLVYAVSVARFEVNFSVPVVVRQGEGARKGLSIGVGLQFL